MNILHNSPKRRTYRAPMIVSIELDNEISLSLESTNAPSDPKSTVRAPEYFNNNPFKASIV